MTGTMMLLNTKGKTGKTAGSANAADTANVRFRAARREDGAAMWALVRSAGTLEVNSAYFYLLLASDFGHTCLLAERGKKLVGVVIGYRPPLDPEAAFVWQIGLAPEEQGKGLGQRLLGEWLNLPANRDARWLTATVALDNAASRRLFERFAVSCAVRCEQLEHFTADLFPHEHEAEQLFRIGPLDAAAREAIQRSISNSTSNIQPMGDIADMTVFEQYESEVRGYCRNFPAVFDTAKGAWMIDTEGRRYLDFFAGAGVLNYGHNPDRLKEALVEYLMRDGITHTLDMYSVAKQHFIEQFQQVILAPRGLNYKMQFPGPTGTNAVEAALKLARKVTGRERVVSFTNAFHGMTLGSLAVTGNGFKRAGAGVPLNHTVSVPFDGYMGEQVDTLDYLQAMLTDDGSGMDKPAAVIVETVQAEGGVNVACMQWLKRLREITEEHGVLLIVDDIQVGCGRTGKFFSFEEAGIVPDIVTLSKSLSGYGLPLALVLFKPELDQWAPGEHNGTFRGHCPAFITATAALSFWQNDWLSKSVQAKGRLATERLQKMLKNLGVKAEVRGRGLIIGVSFEDAAFAGQVSAACFERGMIIETAGINDEVLKLLPSLTISEEELSKGLDIIEQSIKATMKGDSLSAA